jgi:hypothetical protein
MKLGRIILYSKDKNSLSLFLSDIFDMEIVNGEDEIILQSDIFTILILDSKSKAKKAQKNKETIIDISLDNSYELHSYIKRYEFLKYRQGTDESKQAIEIQSLSKWQYFDMEDPDGRLWRFSATT